MIQVKLMVGTLSEKSQSLSLGKHFMNRYKDVMNVELISLDLPLYNGDVDNDVDRPNSVRNFYEAMEEADAFILITPEYNNSISGVLKNAIDWASRSKDFPNKPALLAASSMGMTGGARGYMHLYEILQRIPMYTMPGNDILVSNAHLKINEMGELHDEATIQFIDKVVDNFLIYYQKITR